MNRWEQGQMSLLLDAEQIQEGNKYGGIDRWLEHEESPMKNPNLFSNLCKNLNQYQNEYKKLSSISHHRKKQSKMNSTHCFPTNKQNRNQVLSSKIYRRKHMTTQIQKKRNNLTKDKKVRINYENNENKHHAHTLGKQNYYDNIQMSLKPNLLDNDTEISRSKNLLASLNINVKHLKFDKKSQGMPKKRDRYRQIFGEKPKFVLVKRSSENATNKQSIIYPKFR